MNEAKKPEYILAELTLCGKKKVHLLVEGDFDLSFWRNKIHPDTPDARQDSSPSGERRLSTSPAVPVSVPQ